MTLTILSRIDRALQLWLGRGSRIYFVFTFLLLRSLLHWILNDLFEGLVVLYFIYHLFGVIYVCKDALLTQYLITASKKGRLRHHVNLTAVFGVFLDHEWFRAPSHSGSLLVLKEYLFIAFIDNYKSFIHLVQKQLSQKLRLREEKTRSCDDYMSYENCKEKLASHDEEVD